MIAKYYSSLVTKEGILQQYAPDLAASYLAGRLDDAHDSN